MTGPVITGPVHCTPTIRLGQRIAHLTKGRDSFVFTMACVQVGNDWFKEFQTEKGAGASHALAHKLEHQGVLPTALHHHRMVHPR